MGRERESCNAPRPRSAHLHLLACSREPGYVIAFLATVATPVELSGSPVVDLCAGREEETHGRRACPNPNPNADHAQKGLLADVVSVGGVLFSFVGGLVGYSANAMRTAKG